jgi:hypothetical protein
LHLIPPLRQPLDLADVVRQSQGVFPRFTYVGARRRGWGPSNLSPL